MESKVILVYFIYYRQFEWMTSYRPNECIVILYSVILMVYSVHSTSFPYLSVLGEGSLLRGSS